MADASAAKRGLDKQLQDVEDKRSPDHKKAKKEKKDKKEKKSKKERRREEAEHWKSQASNTPQRAHSEELDAVKSSPARKETIRKYSEARSTSSRTSATMEVRSGEERLKAAEQDIDQLWQDSNVLFSGMKQMQKQQAYLMQRDTAQARKEANTQVVVSNWPPHAQEDDRDRIIEWLIFQAQIPAREYLHASHKTQPDAISRITIMHFRSVWSTKKFIEYVKKFASGKYPLPFWEADNTVPQDSTGRPYHLQIRQQICTPDRIRSIPLKAFLQCINDNPNCIYHNQTRNLYKNWSSHVIANEEGNLLKCLFNDADGTVKMLIREDLFNMVENSIAASWKTVVARPSDDDLANRKGKGKAGKGGPASSTTSHSVKGTQDYLYNVHLVKVRPTHEEDDEEAL